MAKRFEDLTPEQQAKRRAKIRKQVRREMDRLARKRAQRGETAA